MGGRKILKGVMGETANKKKNSPLRVLHCVVGMNVGGYETLIMNLFRHIDREKVCFDFVVSQDGVFDDEIRELGGKIFKIPFITEVGPFVYARELRKVFLQEPQYSIVHSHMDKFSGMVVREAYKCGIPVRIAHAHSTANGGGLAFQIVKNYYGVFLERYATDLFACSKAAAHWMFRNREEKAVIFPNGIDLEKFRANRTEREKLREELRLNHCFVVGHVGRFVPPKNHSFLLSVFAEVVKKDSSARLMLIGDGPLREKLEKKTMQLDISDKVLFLGERDDVAQLLQAMDVFVFPSIYEGLPVALIEAQASGLPCVISDVIDDKACAGQNIARLSLHQVPILWARAVLNASNMLKKDNTQALKRNGYDIETATSSLQRFYERASQRCEF